MKDKILKYPIPMRNTIYILLLSLLVNSCTDSTKENENTNTLDSEKTEVHTVVEKEIISKTILDDVKLNKSLEDGMYRINRMGDSISTLKPILADEMIISFNQEFIDKTDQEPIFLVISTSEFAPLTLKEKPTLTPGKEDRKNLLLSLNKLGKEQLEKFTAKNVENMTSIVVNGEALTKHMIREAITGGLLQISRCTDNACELLFVELADNVVIN